MSGDLRRVAHLDMDAFFASVELLKYPELKGCPVVIGGGKAQQPVVLPDGSRIFSRLKDYIGRGVVTTSTYEARAFGIFSAMGIMKAAKMAPECIILPTDFEAYRHYSNAFKSAVAKISPVIENVGIDEIYIDLTDEVRDSELIAKEIKYAVFAATGINCSIGIAENKLLAKICSDLEKPNGLTILNKSDIRTRIWPLPVRKINGIGPKANSKLSEIGINTIGELAASDIMVLQAQFGTRYAIWLSAVAQGIDHRQVKTFRPTKSVSREATFERDLHVKIDRQILSEKLCSLCTRVSDDLEKHQIVGRTIGIKIKFSDFSIVTRDITLPYFTCDPKIILNSVRDCLKRIPLEKRIRLLGVRVHTFELIGSHRNVEMQYELFADN